MCCAWRVNQIGSLPDDIDALRVLALNAIAERDAAIAERDRLIELKTACVGCYARRRASKQKASGWPSFIPISSIWR